MGCVDDKNRKVKRRTAVVAEAEVVVVAEVVAETLWLWLWLCNIVSAWNIHTNKGLGPWLNSTALA